MQAINFKFWGFILFISCTAFTCFHYQTVFEEVKITSDFKGYKNGFHFAKVTIYGEHIDEIKVLPKKIGNENESIFLKYYSTSKSVFTLLHRDCLAPEIRPIITGELSSIIITSKPLMELVKIEVKANGTNERVVVSDTKEMCSDLIEDSPFTTSFTMRDTSFFIPVFPDSVNPVFIRIADKLIFEKDLEIKRDIVTIKM